MRDAGFEDSKSAQPVRDLARVNVDGSYNSRVEFRESKSESDES